jgi:hypothetical protein
LVDAPPAGLPAGEHHPVLLEQLHPALLPGVLVLAYDDRLLVAPHKEQGVHYVQVLVHVLLGR